MTARLSVHATSVVLDGCAALLTGPPGAGKSRLALELMALGAGLIADDVTVLSRKDGGVVASAPQTAPALIEARGVGLLPARLSPPAPLAFVVELAQQSGPRLPQSRNTNLLGVEIPLLSSAPAAVVLHCLRHGPPVDPEAPRFERD